jgi:hypothetical protein
MEESKGSKQGNLSIEWLERCDKRRGSGGNMGDEIKLEIWADYT